MIGDITNSLEAIPAPIFYTSVMWKVEAFSSHWEWTLEWSRRHPVSNLWNEKYTHREFVCPVCFNTCTAWKRSINSQHLVFNIKCLILTYIKYEKTTWFYFCYYFYLKINTCHSWVTHLTMCFSFCCIEGTISSKNGKVWSRK